MPSPFDPERGVLRRWAIWPFAVASLYGCAPADGASLGGHQPNVTIAAETVVSDDALGWVVDLQLVGDRIVGLDAMLDPSVHVFDLETLRPLASYGRDGDGPGEFKDPEQIVVGASDSRDEVWILDGVHQRLTRVSLEAMEAGAEIVPETLPMDGPNAGSLVRVPDGRWFAGGWITEGRVGRFHADRSYDRTIVGFPPEVEAPGMTLLQAYESRVVADPAGGRLAAATILGGLLEIFDYEGVPVARAEVPDPFHPAFVQGRSRADKAVMSVGSETRYGFTDLAATRRHLYALFSGGKVMEEGTPWATNEVQVYTWGGEYVKSLCLDRTVHAVTVDASDTWLYASGAEPGPWVGRFRLP